jgi:TetR/AcrR family transcriptional repressor of mexJK operon
MNSPRSRSIRTPQQARSRRTLERVHQAALECFETQGFDATTTAMIAARAGIAVGTVYSYFTDKREILLELIDTRIAERTSFVIGELDPGRWGNRTPREVVHSLMEALFHTALIQPGVQRIMWERYFKDPEFQQRMAGMREQIRLAVSGFLALLERGDLLAPIDREMASYVIVNAVQWNSTMAFTENTPQERDAVAHAMTQMVERYVFRDGAGHGAPLAPLSIDA